MSQKVYVQNMRGHPLMPTKPAKARHLLEEGRAEVVEKSPFTIRLKYATGENKQEIRLGVDAGYSKVGFSAVTEKEELIEGVFELRNDISKKLKQKRNYRRERRNRNTRHRKPRFDNRKKEDGWLAPSIKHKKNAHQKLVNKLKELLPITEIIVEVAKFDTQKMENPEVEGVEYQQGTLKGYHVREYLLEKWNNECAYCGKENVPLEVEHVVPKSRGGSDRVSNLTISCHQCNQEKGNQTAKEFGHPEVQEKAKQTLKEAAFMNQVRWKIVNELNCSYTFGYITKKRRIGFGLEKSHTNDAFIIAGGTNQKRCESFQVTQTRRNNRSLQTNRNGYKPSIRRKRYKFQPNDLVRCEGKTVRSKGSHCYGKRVVLEDLGSKSVKNVELITYGKGFVFN